MAWLILLIVAWGALAFGSVYDWARWPLVVACVVAGAWGFARAVPNERRWVNGPVLAGLLLVTLAVGFQLVPLDRHTLRNWSPATHTFLKQYNLQYAMATARSEDLAPRKEGDEPQAPRLKHPLSSDPPKTQLGLLLGFGFMLLGLARGIGGRDLRV
jgi:hypothetical protein